MSVLDNPFLVVIFSWSVAIIICNLSLFFQLRFQGCNCGRRNFHFVNGESVWAVRIASGLIFPPHEQCSLIADSVSMVFLFVTWNDFNAVFGAVVSIGSGHPLTAGRYNVILLQSVVNRHKAPPSRIFEDVIKRIGTVAAQQVRQFLAMADCEVLHVNVRRTSTGIGTYSPIGDAISRTR